MKKVIFEMDSYLRKEWDIWVGNIHNLLVYKIILQVPCPYEKCICRKHDLNWDYLLLITCYLLLITYSTSQPQQPIYLPPQFRNTTEPPQLPHESQVSWAETG